MHADNVSQLCDCEQVKSARQVRCGIIFLVLGLILLALGGWHVADFLRHPELVGQPHNLLGHLVAKAFSATTPSGDETQRMLGQLAQFAGGAIGYQAIIYGMVAIGLVLCQGGVQLLWRGLKKGPQLCPHCGSMR